MTRDSIPRLIWTTAISMALGWAACNLVAWAYGIPWYFQIRPSLNLVLVNMRMAAMISGVAAFICWLFIFLPTYIFVPKDSRLRQAKVAPLVGGAVGFWVMYLFWIVALALNEGGFEFEDALRVLAADETRFFLFASAAAGFLAAYVQSRFSPGEARVIGSGSRIS